MNRIFGRDWGRGKLIALAVAFAFLVSAAVLVGVLALGPTSAAASHAEYGQPPEPVQAATQPSNQKAAVIVQKAYRTGQAEALVRSLGGVVTKDLSLINAFAAEIPAGALSQVAASPSVARVTADGPVESTSYYSYRTSRDYTSTDTPAPANYYRETLGISSLHGPTGAGIGVAVIDSGIDPHSDFARRIRVQTSFVNSASVLDTYGHGTHVAGIIAGDGGASGGLYKGIAPGASLLSLKITDGQGVATESDVVAAMQWIYDNRVKYNIRVVNLSLNSGDSASYKESPLDAACEVLWFDGVVVVASAGNKGPAGGSNTIDSAPANDPFIITVGASDEKGDSSRYNDVLASFSASGKTRDGFSKPEIVAPGTSIYSTLSADSAWAAEYPDRTQFGGQYFRLSGTSMSAPMVSGVVALLLEDEPNLTPDQVKYRLMATAPSRLGNTWSAYISAPAAINGTTTRSANTGIAASTLLWSGTEPVMWNSVMWNSVMWNSVMWNSVMWNSVMWNSVMWNSVMWNSVMSNSIDWTH
jgi:serine protease AprX